MHIIKDLIVALLLMVVRLLVIVLGASILIGSGYYIFKLVTQLGERIIPLWVILYTLNKRIRTLAFLDCRKYNDGSSTYDRIENPENYHLRLENWEDSFSNFLIRYIPRIRTTTDFARYPLPFGLAESDNIPKYLKKVWVWNTLLLVFCGVWLYGLLGEILHFVTPVWILSIIVGLLYMGAEKRNPSIRRKTRRRLSWIRKDMLELCETLSWGIITRSRWLTPRRVRVCLYSVLGGLLLETLLIVRQYNLWEVLKW